MLGVVNCNEHHLVWGVTRYTPEEDDKILITNYQFIQTLNLSDEDIKQLRNTLKK